MLLPVAWTLFAVAAVGAFLMIAAYWLDLGERGDISSRRRLAWRAAIVLFPVSIPVYAFAGGAGWPRFLRIASFVPLVALGLLLGFVMGVFS